MATKIFISRNLTAENIFLQRLSTTDVQVHGESLLQFTLIPFAQVPKVDWIFFYSKTAVRFFFQQLSSPPPSFQYAAIGERTATFLKKYIQKIDFIGNGQPAETAQHFSAYAQGERVLFPRARRSRKSIQTLLEKEIEVVDLVIYDNQVRTDIELPDFDILVFTSPLNVQAYFQSKNYQSHQKIVAIGNTTAGALRELGLRHIYIAKIPSEMGLAETVLSLLHSY